jgi:hypothetical protein
MPTPKSKSDKEQLFDCIVGLSERARKLNEKDVAGILATLAGAIKSNSTCYLADLCSTFAKMQLEQCLLMEVIQSVAPHAAEMIDEAKKTPDKV